MKSLINAKIFPAAHDRGAAPARRTSVGLVAARIPAHDRDRDRQHGNVMEMATKHGKLSICEWHRGKSAPPRLRVMQAHPSRTMEPGADRQMAQIIFEAGREPAHYFPSSPLCRFRHCGLSFPDRQPS
jgi:hypothetical protein